MLRGNEPRFRGQFAASLLFSLGMQHFHEKCLRWGTSSTVLWIEMILTTCSHRMNFRNNTYQFCEFLLLRVDADGWAFKMGMNERRWWGINGGQATQQQRWTLQVEEGRQRERKKKCEKHKSDEINFNLLVKIMICFFKFFFLLRRLKYSTVGLIYMAQWNRTKKKMHQISNISIISWRPMNLAISRIISNNGHLPQRMDNMWVYNPIKLLEHFHSPRVLFCDSLCLALLYAFAQSPSHTKTNWCHRHDARNYHKTREREREIEVHFDERI